MNPEDAQKRQVGGGPLWRDILCWALVAPLVFLLVVRVFGLESGPILVPVISWVPPLTLVAFAVAIVAFYLGKKAPALVALGVCFWFVLILLPRNAANEPGPTIEPEVRVLAANLYRGHADLDELVRLVEEEDVDVLALSEVTSRVPARLQELGLPGLLPNADYTRLAKARPGGAIYSRLPIVSEPPILSPLMPRATVIAGDTEIEFVAVHTTAPFPEAIDFWRQSIEKLPAADEPGTQLLVGDFNATLDHVELRDLIDTGYSDAAEKTGDGLAPTWPAGRVIPPGVTIDHVLADPALEVLDYQVHELPGSDHRAIVATVAPDAPEDP